MLPSAKVIALLEDPTDPLVGLEQKDAREAARTLGVQLDIVNASTPSEIDAALASLHGRAGALILGATPYFGARRQQIVALAMRDGIPVVAANPEFAAEGALFTYGNDPLDLYRRAGFYTGRILRGEKPGELPIDQATRFELVINFKTAKTLGINIPSGLLSIADEVIQ
jgi:putative ABC transport system substrate-binding protein